VWVGVGVCVTVAVLVGVSVAVAVWVAVGEGEGDGGLVGVELGTIGTVQICNPQANRPSCGPDPAGSAEVAVAAGLLGIAVGVVLTPGVTLAGVQVGERAGAPVTEAAGCDVGLAAGSTVVAVAVEPGFDVAVASGFDVAVEPGFDVALAAGFGVVLVSGRKSSTCDVVIAPGTLSLLALAGRALDDWPTLKLLYVMEVCWSPEALSPPTEVTTTSIVQVPFAMSPAKVLFRDWSGRYVPVKLLLVQ
jgi:hypothetical protein